MAVVKPLYVVSGNLQEMDTTKVDQLIARAVYQDSLSPTVVLSVVVKSTFAFLYTLATDKPRESLLLLFYFI